MRHPLTDEFAAELYHRTPPAGLDGDVPRPPDGWMPWEATTPEIREIFRGRARRFLAGEIDVLPWSLPPGWRLPDGLEDGRR